MLNKQSNNNTLPTTKPGALTTEDVVIMTDKSTLTLFDASDILIGDNTDSDVPNDDFASINQQSNPYDEDLRVAERIPLSTDADVPPEGDIDAIVQSMRVDTDNHPSDDTKSIKQTIDEKYATDLAVIDLFIRSGNVDKIIDYCKTLNAEIGPLVRPRLQNAFANSEEILLINRKLSFKTDKLSKRIRADLVKWGYDDIKLNQLDDTIEIAGERLRDSHEKQINTIARDAGYGGKAKPLIAIHDVIDVIANENAYHPIRDYLDGLQWDGKNHIGKMGQYVTDNHKPITYQNGTQTSVFSAFFGRWVIGSIGKIFSSGAVKVQNPMLVLTGGQGLGKSTFIEWLCPLPQYGCFCKTPRKGALSSCFL